ncbi:MAG: undecaprenyldiphospho-muramoylpentapeptide beta-N-acetylglucosaminyltransferase [Betaproteobacteria bacterium]|nr:undecaprenyldiphospho-muramoylpentapeptide beta-N-acetylglucosaminyltransferase [Betaproteobacteria bacterium]
MTAADDRSRYRAGAARDTTRTLLVMAGGTGGHIMPALAVADELRARGWRIVWLGSRQGMEATLVPTRGYPLEFVRFAGLRGKGLARALFLPVNLLVAFWQCARVILRVRPDVVLGMGGYISFPGGMMAAFLGRPLVLHEQNAIAGLANRVLAQVADRRMTGFPDVLPKSEWCGNPVRAEIVALPEPRARYGTRQGRLRLLVVGGSLGAQALNDVIPRGLAIVPDASRPIVRHQAGTRHIDALRENYATASVDAECVAFIDDMAAALGEADCVICRAGALTVAELAAAGVASVLVPYPHAVDDHQSANARFLSNAGAAVVVQQRELTPHRVAEILLAFTRDRLADMAARARALSRPDAARRVADVCGELAA